MGDILGSVSLVASIANAVASTAIFVSLSSGIAANLAALNSYILSNNIQITILQAKTQFQTIALDLSENRNSTL